MLRHEAEEGAIFISPFDHRDIVAGQGTCGLEILEQVPDQKIAWAATEGATNAGAVRFDDQAEFEAPIRARNFGAVEVWNRDGQKVR